MNPQFNTIKKEKIKVIDWLIEHFPMAFFKKTKQVMPLKIGIFEDIMDFYQRLDSPPFSKKILREALNYYSTSPAYLNAQKEGIARLDLYGNEVDIVTQEQAHYAYQRYEQRYAARKTETQKNTSLPESTLDIQDEIIKS